MSTAEPPPDLDAAAIALACRITCVNVDGQIWRTMPDRTPLQDLQATVEAMKVFARAVVNDARLRGEIPPDPQTPDVGAISRALVNESLKHREKAEHVARLESELIAVREEASVAREALALAKLALEESKRDVAHLATQVAQPKAIIDELRVALVKARCERQDEKDRASHAATELAKARATIDELMAALAQRPVIDPAKLAAWRACMRKRQAEVLFKLREDEPADNVFCRAADLLESLQDP